MNNSSLGAVVETGSRVAYSPVKLDLDWLDDMNAPSSDSRESIPVVCEVCNTRVYVTRAQIGQTVACPDCFTRNRVKPLPKPVAPPKPKYTGDEYRLARDPKKRNPSTNLVSVTCGTCSTMMYARREHVGKRIRCPDCSDLTLIRPPRISEKKFTPPDVSDIQVEAAPPPDIDEKRKDFADQLMAEAEAEVERKRSEEPIPPQRPLRDGLYHFPFYFNVIPLWLGMGTVALINFALLVTVRELINSGGLSSILAAFVVPILTLGVFGSLGMISPYLLSIVEFTAEGHDKIPHWPSQDLLSRGYSTLTIFNAFTVSALPGMLVVTTLRLIGLPVPSFVGLITTIFLMPLVLLSMLWNGSAFVPYSDIVFKSLRQTMRSWQSIWLQLSLVGLLVIGIELGIQIAIDPTVAICVSVFTVSIYVLFLHRLVGRMGWIISQIDEPLEEAEEELESAEDEDMGEHEIFADG